MLGELSELGIGTGAHADGGHVPGEHQRGIAQRLATRQLQLLGAQHDGMTAELVDADLEGQPRARGGLLEDQRDAATVERARGERRRLELERAVQQRVELAGRELRASQKIAWHGRASLG